MLAHEAFVACCVVIIRRGPSSAWIEDMASLGTGADTGVCTGARDGADGAGSYTHRPRTDGAGSALSRSRRSSGQRSRRERLFRRSRVEQTFGFAGGRGADARRSWRQWFPGRLPVLPPVGVSRSDAAAVATVEIDFSGPGFGWRPDGHAPRPPRRP